MIPPLLSLSQTTSELQLTYIAEGPTSNNSKRLSCVPYSLLRCDVTAHWQADGHAENMSRDSHILLMCDITNPMPTAGHTEITACSAVAGMHCVYRAVSWQRVEQICHSIKWNEKFFSVPRLSLCIQKESSVNGCSGPMNSEHIEIKLYLNSLKFLLLYFLQTKRSE
jgi:hypothetical protein